LLTAMKISLLLVAAIVLLGVEMCAQAQNADLTPEKCSIDGTVVDAVSEQPLKGAQVRLRGTPNPSGGSSSQSAAQPKTASTDARGRFVFEGLTAGRYLLLASHDGYVNNNHGNANFRDRWLVMSPGQHLADVVLRLQPGGMVAGHITNEAGQPFRGVSVE